MKSPFPGMDPYLEARWGDVHTRLIVYACDQVRGKLPGGLLVRAQEHVTVQIGGTGNGHPAQRHGLDPDVRVVEHPAGAGGQPVAPTPEGGIAVVEPLLVPLALETETQRSIQIIDTRSGNRIVTAIEFLSPTNKSDASGRAAYLQKQAELREAKVNLVEIDLLREGPYVLTAPAHLVPQPYLVPYRICVFRASRPHLAEVYRVPLRERLPGVGIPLRETDPDVRLDLQELIDKAYENGGYDTEIDYRVDPFPPLQGDDAVWADALLREKGRR
jgi:hypothetical protein